MIKQYLNTLFIMTEGAYASLEGDTVKVECEGQKLIQTPLHHLGTICTLGRVTLSQPLMIRCAEDGRTVVMMDRHGRFKARVSGPTTGNILLRMAQLGFHDDAERALCYAKCVVAGKLQNARQVLLRAAREDHRGGRDALVAAA